VRVAAGEQDSEVLPVDGAVQVERGAAGAAPAAGRLPGVDVVILSAVSDLLEVVLALAGRHLADAEHVRSTA